MFMGNKILAPTTLAVPPGLDIGDKAAVAANLRAAVDAYNSAAFLAQSHNLHYQLEIKVGDHIAIPGQPHALVIGEITHAEVTKF